ncbi:hypothetical protein EXN66_Car015584 [Channa argus]|uniref:Uncharacterized protein n=1 Tax=Channa argus TaxID=215402 RepID=A0A6G1QBN5_CHAAH|nr:hypothetical protein EXN66_Car015584 [Channa argus]
MQALLICSFDTGTILKDRLSVLPQQLHHSDYITVVWGLVECLFYSLAVTVPAW